MDAKKPDMAMYKLTQFLSGIVANVVFRRKFIRNEIKDKKGPFVIIANHEAALDFTTLIGATNEPQTFVVSDSFYKTLPFTKAMDKLGVISKQQFQTSVKEITKMRKTIANGGILTFYPAGLMSEDGLSTPIPCATYGFLQWLDTDVYVARISGSYFCTPKWSSKIRPGRTYLDVYKLIDKSHLKEMTVEQIKEAVDKALLFDAYREQEDHKIKYLGGNNVKGLENVLYVCPNCKSEFSIKVKKNKTLYCEKCGFAHTSDKYGFLHNSGIVGGEIRYVSDWAKFVYNKTKSDIQSGELGDITTHATIQTIDVSKHKYVDVGYAKITLTPKKFIIDGPIDCKHQTIEIPLSQFASLPFKPGCRIEVQHNKVSYRCVLDDGKLAMKLINMVKAYYEMNQDKQ